MASSGLLLGLNSLAAAFSLNVGGLPTTCPRVASYQLNLSDKVDEATEGGGRYAGYATYTARAVALALYVPGGSWEGTEGLKCSLCCKFVELAILSETIGRAPYCG